MSITTSTELFINMKNVPKYNAKKHFFEQKTDVLDFYAEEKHKLLYGTNIGGYFLHPWLYWHINYFKTPLPIIENGRPREKILNPPLDDNMLYVTDTYKQAEEENMGMCIFGARGVSKSTYIASLTSWLATTRENGTTSIIGGNDGDLNAISALLQIGMDSVTPAFALPRLKTNWKSLVEFGIKEKNNTKHIHSRFDIKNADDKKESASEKGAGLSPVGYVMDEIGKFSFLKGLESALPSFQTEHGAKLVHLLSGTSGNAALTKDAKKVMQNPGEYSLLMLNLDRLNRNVPEEAMTWKGDKEKDFCTFMPGQMSYRLAVPKVEKKLSDFVGISDRTLGKIKIRVTDWIPATKHIEKHLAGLKKESSIQKYKMYYPTKTDHCFLIDAVNPFPTAIISRRIEELEAKGKIGKSVSIYKDEGKYKFEFSNKKRAEVSHGGGIADAPIILFGELPETTPDKFTYVGGGDYYKLDVSDTDSLGSLYIIKRRNLAVNEPCETIVASLTTRPERMINFLEDSETIVKTWNAMTNIESIDVAFLHHLEGKGLHYEYLCPAFSFTQKMSKAKSKLNSKFGLFPSTGNNSYRFNYYVKWSWEEHIMGISEDGNPIIKLGVEFIECLDLLKEMLHYKKGNNVDRMTSFSHALVYAEQLDKEMIIPTKKNKKNTQTLKEIANRKHLTRKSNPYGNGGNVRRY